MSIFLDYYNVCQTSFLKYRNQFYQLSVKQALEYRNKDDPKDAWFIRVRRFSSSTKNILR